MLEIDDDRWVLALYSLQTPLLQGTRVTQGRAALQISVTQHGSTSHPAARCLAMQLQIRATTKI